MEKRPHPDKVITFLGSARVTDEERNFLLCLPFVPDKTIKRFSSIKKKRGSFDILPRL